MIKKLYRRMRDAAVMDTVEEQLYCELIALCELCDRKKSARFYRRVMAFRIAWPILSLMVIESIRSMLLLTLARASRRR